MKDTTDQNLNGLTVGSLAVIGAGGGAGASDLRAPACSTRFDSKKWCPRAESNCHSRFRKPVLYPIELPGQSFDKLRIYLGIVWKPVSSVNVLPSQSVGSVGAVDPGLAAPRNGPGGRIDPP